MPADYGRPFADFNFYINATVSTFTITFHAPGRYPFGSLGTTFTILPQSGATPVYYFTTYNEACTADVACSIPAYVNFWSDDSAAAEFTATLTLSSNGGGSVQFASPTINVTSNGGSFYIDGVVFTNFTGSDPFYSVTVRGERVEWRS